MVSTWTQKIKPQIVKLPSRESLSSSPGCSPSDTAPSYATGKELANGPSTCAPHIHVGDSDGVQVPASAQFQMFAAF